MTLLAERTEGFSGSEIKELCRNAAMLPMRELLREVGDNENENGSGFCTWTGGSEVRGASEFRWVYLMIRANLLGLSYSFLLCFGRRETMPSA